MHASAISTGVLSLLLLISMNLRAQETLESASDGSWVTVKGTIVAQQADSFTLDLGPDTITVEVDDWDASKDQGRASNGDKVSVRGRVDNDFYHERSIEAETIYIEDRNVVIHAPSARDEEDAIIHFQTYYMPPIDDDMQVSGTVTSVTGRRFTIDNDQRRITVDTAEMSYNPIDGQGYQQIEIGDFVHVTGHFDGKRLGDRIIVADKVVSVE